MPADKIDFERVDALAREMQDFRDPDGSNILLVRAQTLARAWIARNTPASAAKP